MLNELNVNLDVKYKNLWRIFENTSKLSLVYPFEDICFICNKPKEIKLQNNVLHSENSPAIYYDETFKVYMLNGVKVAEEIVMTKAEDLDPKILLKETNADVRREIVRKIGIERVLEKLGYSTLDKSKDGMYELVLLDIGDNNKRPYLKMKNPSVDIWHIEGVPQGIDTIEKALAWRDGEEYYIKPDVLK
jgi:hypothetical protein